MTTTHAHALTLVCTLFAALGCGSVTVTNTGSGSGGSTGGSPGSGGSASGGQGGAHVCGPQATCTHCNNGACCGDSCCNQGEWCDTSGGTPVCRCGSAGACTDGNSCTAPLGGADQCGVICCQGNDCPLSRRAFKRDVHPLNAAEIDQVYAQLRNIKLTTYRYKSEPASAAPRLGFIIDDTASEYPINGDGNSVNLYGYTSMAVAAIQAQSQEIAALRAEVARLRRDVARPRGAGRK